MSGFRKAKSEQAALKVGIFGPAGSGKTFTALLFAEGLAKRAGKRFAFVDTENGTEFYAMHVKDRNIHPEPFDFDALYTRSLTEVSREIEKLDYKEYEVVVIDSFTHIWDSCRNAGGDGQIPIHQWGKIKRPWKKLVNFLLSSPMHVFICMRQGVDYQKVDGELEVVGVKAKCEGETPYEPHILLRMQAVKRQGKDAVPTIFPEKDRTGMLFGKTFPMPTYESVIVPLLPLLGDVQAKVQDESEVAIIDAEALQNEELEAVDVSTKVFKSWRAKIDQCQTKAELANLGKTLTPAIKKTMVAEDLKVLKSHWVETERTLPA